MKDKVVLILSGGADSTTVLYELIHQKKEVYALSFIYGQKATRELDCAKYICEINNVNHKIIDISSIQSLMDSCSIIQNNENSMSLEEEINTVVPSRNTILLELATAYAINIGARQVYYGSHKTDRNMFPDCRPIFVEKLNELNKVNNYDYIEIVAPLLDMEKWEVLKKGLELGVPYEHTWSCYSQEQEPCGVCASCVIREKAMEKARKELGL